MKADADLVVNLSEKADAVKLVEEADAANLGEEADVVNLDEKTRIVSEEGIADAAYNSALKAAALTITYRNAKRRNQQIIRVVLFTNGLRFPTVFPSIRNNWRPHRCGLVAESWY